MTTRAAVRQDPDNEIPTEIIAAHIVAIADGIKRLRSGKLNDKALFLLIQQASPTQGGSGARIPISVIRDVFDGIDSLKATYLRQPQKGGR